ncbi:DNA repair protein XRCC3-like [Mizuhopecten yessoensis]|uniref:DNA repair protein XRCC3 n=1 Tax=Mizuhopecten yessoensis TaxID=6573 RepID=A0A210PP54_MIZYE|nr:DNA repair protein XRCC3-like [Mizuhopecten yessoensis]OWF38226.1 DNA repair protein XRCC3 [Mizuhopecten yessoensis]
MEKLDINPRIIAGIRKASLRTFESILSLSTPDIERSTNLSSGDVHVLKTAVAQAVPKLPVVSALDILHRDCPETLVVSKLTTGCDVIDKALRGGILSQGITEIAGESASGKTQLCLQISLTVQLPQKLGGLNGGAAYICTEDIFPNKRLHQMIQHFTRKTSAKLPKPINFGDRIFIEHVSDMEDLTKCIKMKLPLLLSKGVIKLVVVDSVAALFRCEYEAWEMVKRSKHLTSFAATLHQLSHQYGIPIVCVNQVTDSMKTKETRKHVPALGLTWANQVTCRIMLSRTNHQISVPKQVVNSSVIGGFQTCVRHFEVIFAPHLPMLKVPFIVDQEGIKALT